MRWLIVLWLAACGGEQCISTIEQSCRERTSDCPMTWGDAQKPAAWSCNSASVTLFSCEDTLIAERVHLDRITIERFVFDPQTQQLALIEHDANGKAYCAADTVTGLARHCDRLFAAIAPTGALCPQPVGESFCNPLAQTGCNAGDRCAWIYDQVSPPLGHIGCATPAATPIPEGGSCAYSPGLLGSDNCVIGAVCVDGECEHICDPQQPTCTCTTHAGVFFVGGTFVAGTCAP